MKTIIGRSVGVGISGGVFLLGLWSLNNYEHAWVLVSGITTIIVGATMLLAVSRTIEKDVMTWEERRYE